jgi:Protoglobin
LLGAASSELRERGGVVSHERREGIPGYGYGTQEIARSPLTSEDLDLLKRTVMFSEEDERYLRMAGDVLEGQAGDILDLWYGFVGDNPHLIYYFSDARTGEPNSEYLARVRKRFSQWILDTCRRPYDQDWLDYHHEIALRHTRAKKNETDGAYDTPDNIPLRYIIAFVYPITATIKPFLEGGGHSAEEVDKMHDAWFKSVVLQVALWSRPYAREGDF